MLFYPIYLRGLACLAAGLADQAKAEFQKVLDYPGLTGNYLLGTRDREPFQKLAARHSDAIGQNRKRGSHIPITGCRQSCRERFLLQKRRKEKTEKLRYSHSVGGFRKVKLAKLAAAILALAMLWQSFAVAQDGAKPSQTTTGSSEQIKGTVPASQSASSLSENGPAENQPMESMPRKYIQMWNSGDLQAVTTLFTHPVFITFHGQRRLLDTGTLAKVILSWRKSMPDLNFKIEDTIVQGDRVAMRLTFSGSYKERLFADTAAPEAAPRKIHAVEMLMFQIRDGKVSEIWDDYDELVMRLQMGAVWRSNDQLATCPCKPDADSTQAPAPLSRP